MRTMGLTFDNPNNLNKMLDKFAVVPDPKKTPKRPNPIEPINKNEDEDVEDKEDKKKNSKKK